MQCIFYYIFCSFRHANVYTAEEITLLTREKLKKLQSLYIDQYRHLQYILREKRRKYLHSLKREKETCCSIHNQIRDSPKEQRLYKKLKAYNQYHKKNGIDAILHKRAHESRLKITEGVAPKPPAHTKCAFTEGGVKCGERALPVARHCRKHILEDPNQVLFRACGKMKADVECTTPVEAIFDDQTCQLHMDIPQIRSYAHIRKDSESDYEDSMDATNQSNMTFNENVKTEFVNNSNDSHALLPFDNNASDLFFGINDDVKEETIDTTDDIFSFPIKNEVVDSLNDSFLKDNLEGDLNLVIDEGPDETIADTIEQNKEGTTDSATSITD